MPAYVSDGLRLDGTFDTETKTFTVTSVNNHEGAYHYLLYINNEKEYTPGGDYNPATKKYVDDIVGDINSILDTINGEEV